MDRTAKISFARNEASRLFGTQYSSSARWRHFEYSRSGGPQGPRSS